MAERLQSPIVFGYVGGDWGAGLGRHGALMRALSAFAPVVLLSGATPGKFPRPRPLRLERRADQLYVVHHVHPWQRTGLGRRMGETAHRLDARRLHRFLCRHGLGDYMLWLLHDDLARWRGMDTSRLVFDSIDPCFRPRGQADHDRRERELAQHARVVFCTARSLLERAQRDHPGAVLLPNACDRRSFVPATERDPDAPPMVGYLGTLDERVDVGFLERLARSTPEARFVFAGRVNPDQRERVAALAGLPNVSAPGAISQDEGDRLIAAMDVGVIPFKPGPMGDAINPVKMYMYLAAGKPVLAAPIRECVDQPQPLVFVADPADPAPQLEAALASRTPEGDAQRRRFAEDNTWQARARQAAQVLTEAGLLRATVGGNRR